MTNAVSLAQQASTGVSQGFKNRIINGAMVIDQRNAGASVTGNDNVFPVDRYKVQVSQSSKFTMQQNAGSATPPAGFRNYLGITSSSAYSVGSSDYFFLQQRIEGFNTADLMWGTANAQTVTLSFWVRSSLTGTFGGCLQNDNQDRSYPFSFTISSANTWEYKTITIAGETSGTWLTTNGTGIKVIWGLGVGSTFSGTAGAWNTNNNFSATGATSVVGTNGATFYITGVQLEVGSTATSFDTRSIGTELQLCQRYFFKNSIDSGNGTYMIGVVSSSTAVNRCYNRFPATMRSAPTASFSGSPRLWDGSVDPTVTSISNNNSQTWGSGINIEATGGGLSTGRACLVIDGPPSSSFSFSAEL